MPAEPQEGGHETGAGGDESQDVSHSLDELLLALAILASELSELTSHLRQLAASLAQELRERRVAPHRSPPICGGQLSGVFLAEEGLSDEIVRHSSAWRRLSRQTWRLVGRLRPHLRHKLQRRQAAGRAAVAGLVHACEAAVDLLIALTACRDYSETDAAHFQKLLCMLSSVHAAKSVMLSTSRRAPVPALTGLRLHHHTFSLHEVGRLPSLDNICCRLAQARAGRLASSLQGHLLTGADVNTLLCEVQSGGDAPLSSGPASPAEPAPPALRLPPIPSIQVEPSSPTSAGGDGAAGGLEALLAREQHAVHGLLLAVPAGGRRLAAGQLRPANVDTGRQVSLQRQHGTTGEAPTLALGDR